MSCKAGLNRERARPLKYQQRAESIEFPGIECDGYERRELGGSSRLPKRRGRNMVKIQTNLVLETPGGYRPAVLKLAPGMAALAGELTFWSGYILNDRSVPDDVLLVCSHCSICLFWPCGNVGSKLI